MVEHSKALNRSSYINVGHGGSIRSEKFDFGLLHFSDSILLWSPPIPRGDTTHRDGVFISFLLNLGSMILRGLATGIPLRAGIAFGELFVDPPVIVGKPVVDAYLLEEAQEWVGAAAAESCGPAAFPLVEYVVPMKPGLTVRASALDWTLSGRLGRKAGLQWDPVALLEPCMAAATHETVRTKYANALAFARAQDLPIPGDDAD